MEDTYIRAYNDKLLNNINSLNTVNNITSLNTVNTGSGKLAQLVQGSIGTDLIRMSAGKTYP